MRLRDARHEEATFDRPQAVHLRRVREDRSQQTQLPEGILMDVNTNLSVAKAVVCMVAPADLDDNFVLLHPGFKGRSGKMVDVRFPTGKRLQGIANAQRAQYIGENFLYAPYLGEDLSVAIPKSLIWVPVAALAEIDWVGGHRWANELFRAWLKFDEQGVLD